jgi:MFS family permease
LSLLTDYFPRNQRSTALGIFYLGTAFGTGGIFLVGSVVAANYGWRAAFLVAGLPGLLLAVLVLFTLREPLRGGFDPKLTEAKAAPSIREIGNEVFRRPALIYAIVAATLSVMMVASFYHWTASYLIRQYGVSLEQAGMSMAVATGLMQAIASAIFGPITDRYAGGRPDRIGLVPAAVLLATIPVGLCVLYAPNAWFAIAGVLAFGFMMGAWLAQGFGTVLFLARPQMRGSVAGVVQLLANLVGNGLGPTIAGLVSNSLGGNAASLRWALLYVLLLNLPAAFFFILASRRAGAAEKGQKLR